jgi:hypothetical protein
MLLKGRLQQQYFGRGRHPRDEQVMSSYPKELLSRRKTICVGVKDTRFYTKKSLREDGARNLCASINFYLFSSISFFDNNSGCFVVLCTSLNFLF